MNARSYFQRFNDERERIAELEMKYQAAKDAATRITSRPLDGMPHGSGISDKVGDNAQRMAQYSKMIADCYARLLEMDDKAVPLIMEATRPNHGHNTSFPFVCDVLLHGKSASEVSETYGYTPTYIRSRVQTVYNRLDAKYPDMSIFL